MKIIDKKLPVFLQWFMSIMMVIGTVIMIALPLVVQWMLQYYEGINNETYYITSLIFLYPSGILGLAILYQARKLLKKVNEDQPFIAENTKRIKYIARISAGLSCVYAVAIFFLHSFFVPILCIMFGLIAVFLSVFGELFGKAVEYKNDNDFTI